MKNKKYRIEKYLSMDGEERYSIATLTDLLFFRMYLYDKRLKGLKSLEEAKEIIKKMEDCKNYVEYV